MTIEIESLNFPPALNLYWRNGLKNDAGEYADDPTLLRAILKHEELVKDWQKLNNVRRSYDSRKTVAAHFDNTSKLADRLIRKVAKTTQEVIQDVESRKRQLQNEIDQRLKLRQSPDAAEIRRALLDLSPKQRDKAVNDAIKKVDGEVLYAVFTGRTLTTGIDEDTRQRFIEKAESAHAEDLKDFEHVLDKVIDLMEKTLDYSIELAMQAGGSQEVRERYASEAMAADEAMLAFNESVM